MLADIAASLGLPADLAFVGVNGSVEGGTTTFLGCTRQTPVVAIKIARHAASGRRVADEAALLRLLAQTPAEVSITLPRVLSFSQTPGHGAMALSIVPGRPMPVRVTPTGALDFAQAAVDLSRVAEWLADLQRATSTHDDAVWAAVAQRLRAEAAEFCSIFPLNDAEQSLVSSMTSGIDGLRQAGVVAEHGDFCRQNILCNQTGAVSGVIDWTFGRETGLPLNDIWYLCTLYFLQARRLPGRAGMVAEFDTAVLASGPASDVVQRLLRSHCQRLGIDEASAHHGLAWMLLERALFDARLFRECRDRGAVPRWMLAMAHEANAAPDDVSGHQFWYSLFAVLAARGSAAHA